MKNYRNNINSILDEEINNILNNKIEKKKEILVLSGGFIKGIAQLGALHCLKKNNLLNDIKIIAGSSVGSVTGLFICMRYQPLECFKLFQKVHITKLQKIDPSNIMIKYGLNDGSRVVLVLEKMLIAKGFSKDITFNDFYNKTFINYIVTGSCINDKKTYYFSHKTYPNMKILEAIRISISMPIVFTPCLFEGKIFVDGGCGDNYPIHLFKDTIDKVIGIHVTEIRKTVEDIKYIEDYILNTIYCIFDGMTMNDIRNYEKYTISIKCTNVSDSDKDVIILFDEGYKCAKQKIDSGDFNLV